MPDSVTSQLKDNGMGEHALNHRQLVIYFVPSVEK